MTTRTVVILLSDKRSGSTIFRRELCKHPAIQTIAYSPHTYLETHHWLKSAVMLDMAPETFAGGKVYPGYGSRENARSYLIDGVKGNVPDFQVPQDDRDLVFAGWEALCQQFAQPVFFEKSPQLLAQWAGLSLLLEWVQQTAFQVKIIGLIRNPLAVQYSAFQAFHTNPRERQFGWLKTHKNLLAFQNVLSDGVFFHLKYEDVVAQPAATFQQVCEFIGVSTIPGLGQDIHAQSLEKWKQDPRFTLQLDPAVKQIATAFGYREKELVNPPKPEAPLSYQLKKKWEKIYQLAKARTFDRVIKPILLRLNR